MDQGPRSYRSGSATLEAYLGIYSRVSRRVYKYYSTLINDRQFQYYDILSIYIYIFYIIFLF